MAVINRLNPQTRQLIRLWHNLIRALHFDFRGNKNINIYISPGAPDILYKIWSFSFHKLCIIILTKTTNNDPFYDTSITSDWRKRVLHPPVFAFLIKVNHQLSVLTSGTFGQSLFQFYYDYSDFIVQLDIIQIVPYQSLLANVKNIRELLIESWRASFSQSVVLYQGKTMSQVSNLDNISCDLQETARSWIMSSYFLLSRWPIFISV